MKTSSPELTPEAGAAVVLRHFAEDGTRVNDLCDLLEVIADDLPRITQPVWREALRLIATLLPNHLDDMIGVLIPLLIKRQSTDPTCSRMLQRLQFEFQEGYLRVSELSDLLTDASVSKPSGLSPDAVGYALRGFFETLRRQMSWEQEVLLPLATRCLTDADIATIETSMCQAAKGVPLPAPNVAGSGRA